MISSSRGAMPLSGRFVFTEMMSAVLWYAEMAALTQLERIQGFVTAAQSLEKSSYFRKCACVSPAYGVHTV